MIKKEKSFFYTKESLMRQKNVIPTKTFCKKTDQVRKSSEIQRAAKLNSPRIIKFRK